MEMHHAKMKTTIIEQWLINGGGEPNGKKSSGSGADKRKNTRRG